MHFGITELGHRISDLDKLPEIKGGSSLIRPMLSIWRFILEEYLKKYTLIIAVELHGTKKVRYIQAQGVPREVRFFNMSRSGSTGRWGIEILTKKGLIFPSNYYNKKFLGRLKQKPILLEATKINSSNLGFMGKP